MTARPPSQRASASRVILEAGLVAGVLDIAYVCGYFGWRGVGMGRILRGIAAALQGLPALQGGLSAALGLALHFGVALTVAVVFYGASRKVIWLTQHAVIGGLGYGAAVWLVMNLVVLPLTAVPPRGFPPPQWPVILLAHLFCVGLPIALVVRRHAR